MVWTLVGVARCLAVALSLVRFLRRPRVRLQHLTILCHHLQRFWGFCSLSNVVLHYLFPHALSL